MDFNQKLDSIFGSFSEDRTNKADSGHYKWRGTTGGRAKTNAQQRRKQSTRHGKNVDNAKHAAQADVKRGTFPDGSKVPEKPKNCPQCGRSDKQMIKSHEKGHDKANHHNWKWLCTACHAKKDNNQSGDNTNSGSIRSPQNDGPSGTGNKSGQRESIEYMLSRGIIVEAPESRGAGERFLPQPTRRPRGRGRKRSYTPQYSVSERFPPLRVDAHWNRTHDPKKTVHTIHPVDLGITMATRTGKGDPLKYRRPTVTKNAKYFAFSRPNYLDDNTISPQDEAYIPAEQLMKRYNEIVAVIPKDPRERFTPATINIQGDEVSYQEPEEITGEIKTRYFTPPNQYKAVSMPGSPAAKELPQTQARTPVSGQITMMSNDEIAQFLHPPTTMVGPGATQAARSYEAEQTPRWSSAYMKELAQVLMHGDRSVKVHPDVFRAIKKGLYGKDLAEYFRKNYQAKGRKTLGKSPSTQFSKDLQRLTTKNIQNLPTMETNKGTYKIASVDRNEDKWGYPATKKKTFKARDLPELLQKYQGKKMYFAIFEKGMEEYEHQELLRRLSNAHQIDQYKKGLTRSQPPSYQPRPNPLTVIQLKAAYETAPAEEKEAKFKIDYVDMTTGQSKSIEVAPGFPVIPVVNLTKRLRGKAAKPNRRPGVAESIARHEAREINKISKEVWADFVNPPNNKKPSIKDISRLID